MKPLFVLALLGFCLPAPDAQAELTGETPDICRSAKDAPDTCAPDITITGRVQVAGRSIPWGSAALAEDEVINDGRTCRVRIVIKVANLGLTPAGPQRLSFRSALGKDVLFPKIEPREVRSVATFLTLAPGRTILRVAVSPVARSDVNGPADVRWLILSPPAGCS